MCFMKYCRLSSLQIILHESLFPPLRRKKLYSKSRFFVEASYRAILRCLRFFLYELMHFSWHEGLSLKALKMFCYILFFLRNVYFVITFVQLLFKFFDVKIHERVKTICDIVYEKTTLVLVKGIASWLAIYGISCNNNYMSVLYFNYDLGFLRDMAS